MFAGRKARRRIEDVIAVASPLALAEAMDAHICSRSRDDLRGLIERSFKRMDAGERRQLELYLNVTDPDDLLGHRFSAFLRQNPRAIAALDSEAADAILSQLGDLPAVEHASRRLPPRAAAFVALVVAIAVLPLAAQYAHQRGLLQGLTDPLAAPPPVTPFVQPVAAQTGGHARRPQAPRHSRRIAHHAAKRTHPRMIAQRGTFHRPRSRYTHHRYNAIAWKFDPANNPYLNRSRWRHPFVADSSHFGERARLSVSSYLHAIVAGNLGAALMHLGMPPGSGTNAIAELPIITRRSLIAIVGSKPYGDKEQVQVSINTDGREYYEVFHVARDGPAMRIVDRYYTPVNRRAQVAARLLVQNSH